MTFEADLVSQDAMQRAVTTMVDGSSVDWVLEDNSVVSVTKELLMEVLKEAVAETTKIRTEKRYTPE